MENLSNWIEYDFVAIIRLGNFGGQNNSYFYPDNYSDNGIESFLDQEPAVIGFNNFF